MSKILVIGASGQIGNMITRTLIASNQAVRALVRDKNTLADLKDSGLEIVEMDLEDDFSKAFEEIDSIIFCAGSGAKTGADKTLLIDLWAAKKATDYALKADVEHFVMISSMGAEDPDNLPSDIQPYLIAKYMADRYLALSEVPYTILRPGLLTNEKGKGKITIKRPINRDEMSITRADVATAALFCLNNDRLKNRTFELFNGTYEFKNILV
ncbi:MAG: SDR family oxidoreductase [Marinomonas sp.]